MDRMIEGVDGMENLLRCRDLPRFTRAGDQADWILQYSASQTIRSSEAHALILNTFEELEGPILSCLRRRCSNIYPIGPLHAHLKSRLSGEILRRNRSLPTAFGRWIGAAWRGSTLSRQDPSSTLALEVLRSWEITSSWSSGTDW